MHFRGAALILVPAVALACGSLPNAEDSASSESSIAARSALTLLDRTVVHGTPVAQYDHATWWWDTTNEVTFALFDPAGSSDIPGKDRSLRFIDRSQIAPGQTEPVIPATPPASYRKFVKSRGVVLERLPLDGVAVVLNGHERWHLQEGGFGNFAWDLVRENPDGRTFVNEGRAAADYAVWDSPVYLPTAGWVVDVVDSAPDNVPGTVPGGPINDVKNNMVGVQVAGSYYVYLLHFREGSIPRVARGTCAPAVPGVTCIEPGAWLPVGTYLGRAGNSGVTYEPHVHMTAYFWDTERNPARSWSVPSEFRSLYAAKKGHPPAHVSSFVPQTDDALSNLTF